MEKIKKITALLLSLALLLPLLPATAWATGTEEIPVEVVEAADTEEETTEEDALVEEASAEEEVAEEETAAEEEAPGEVVEVTDTEDETTKDDADDGTLAESVYSALFGTATIAETATGSCGDNLMWELDDSGTLTIKGTGDMEEWEWFSENGAPWSEYQDDIQLVVIENGVTNISNYAFVDCYNLTSVTIPASVTSIGEGAFSWCDSLTSVEIPNGVTTIGVEAFSCCTSLTNITISASVTSIGESAFCDCYSLEAVYYDGTQSDWSAISIGSDNENLTQATIYFADGTTGGGKVCGDNLTWSLDEDGTLTISGTGAMWDFSYDWVEDYYDEETDETYYTLENDIPWYERYITTVIIEDGVTSIGNYAFTEQYDLESVSISGTVTSIGESAFCDCYSLEAVYYDGTQSDWSAISIGSDNENLTQATIYFADGTTGGGKVCGDNLTWSLDEDGTLTISGTGAMWDFSYDWVEDYYDEETDETYYTLETDIPWYERYITTVIIEDGVTSIGNYAFIEQYDLESVSISGTVTSIGQYSFAWCESLTETDVPAGVTSIGSWAFECCTSLTEVTIPNSVTSIGDAAFENCFSLETVYYSGTQNDWSEISIGVYNNFLTQATIYFSDGSSSDDDETVASGTCGDNLTWVLDKNGTLTISGTGEMYDYDAMEGTMPWADYMDSITAVVIESGVTSIGKDAFCWAGNLTSVTIADTVTTIGTECFAYCVLLTELVIPSSVTLIKFLAFDECTALEAVTILSKALTIEDAAFLSCSALADVYFAGSSSEWAAIAIGSSNDCLTDATIYYNSTGPDDVEEHTHTYDTPTWAWSGTSSATATFTCTEGDDTQTVTATVTSTTTAATCTAAGKTVYTAKVTFEGETYTDTKTVTVAATGHTYTTPTWAWSEDYSKVTATFTCSVCGEQETAAATVTYKVTTAATYTAAGTGTYTATVTFNGKTYTDTKTVTIPMLVLTAPTITSLYNSTSGVSMGWDAVDGATSYIVWRLNNSTGKWEKCATTTGTTYLSTSPVSGTTYYYAIEAVNGEVTSGRGTQRYILYMATPKVSLENTTSGIKVSWNSVTGATSGYQVYRRTADTDYELLKAVSTSTTSYTDTTAEAGVRYYYIVRSVRGSARSAYASQYITRLTTPPPITVSNTTSGLQVTWNSVTGATSYQVWRKLSGSSSWSKVGTTTDTSYTSTGVTSGKTYVFTVKAVYNSSVSAYNTTGKTIMRLAEPTITLENLVGGLTASWNAVDGAEGYKLYRRSETGSYVLVATLDADELSYTDKAAAAGVVYYYRVQAYNGSYTSSWTSQFNRRIGHTTLTLTKGEDGVVLTWTKSGGCTGYYIYRMNEDGSYTRIKTITSVDTLTWTDTDVESGNSYTYYIRGYNGSSLGSYTPKNITF